MAELPNITVTIYSDDTSNANDYGFELHIKYINSPIEKLIISDPSIVNPETIINLKNEKKGCISGGGNSYWTIFGSDNKYKINYYISGLGNESSISIVLPEEQTDIFMSVWHDLIVYSRELTLEKFVEQAEILNCVVEWD